MRIKIILIKNNQKNFFVLYIKRYTNTFKMDFFYLTTSIICYLNSVFCVFHVKKNCDLKEAFKDYVVSKFGKAIVFTQCYQQIYMTI